MTQIMIDVPKTKEREYKQIFNTFVKSFTIDELKMINENRIDFKKHNLDELGDENLIAYMKSFDVKENDLINI